MIITEGEDHHANTVTLDGNLQINYDPVLVSSDIKSCIFGIHSENQFEEIINDHKKKTS